MTNKEFLKTEVLKGLSEKLLPYNFTFIKSSSEFVKKNTDSSFNYSPVFLNRDENWEINPTMGIRINQIEEIYHTTSGFEKKYQKGTPTIGISIENYLLNGKEYRFNLENETQISVVVNGLFDLFEKIALPFYEKHSSIKVADTVLNENPKDTSLTGAIFKGSKGIITAKLMKRSNYAELVKIYTDQYKHLADGFYLENFKKLVEVLESSK